MTAQSHESADEGAGTMSAPLGDVSAGRLELAHGAHDIRVRVESGMAELYRAWYEGPAPEITADGGAVKMRFVPDWSHLSRLFRQGAAKAVITLNGAIPWSIALHGGASLIDADLRGLELRGLDVQGGVSRIEVTVSSPRGICPVTFAGGATAFGLHRPAGTAARLGVTGGFAELAFDERLVAKVGGTCRVESSGFDDAADYFDVEITGGATRLKIDTVAA